MSPSPASVAGNDQESTMYAVAGVTGNTGAAVARALLAAGEQVRVIVRRPDAGAEWQARGADVAVADLADAVALATALRGTQGAYLLNPPSYAVADPFGAAAKVGAALASAIDASGIPRAVVLSSVGGHLAAGTGIIGTNHQVERAIAAVKAPVALLRANYFFENWAHMLQPVRANGVLPSFLQPAERAVPMVPVADIATAAVDLLRGAAWQGRRAIDLASFDASPAAVAAAFSAVLGKPVAVAPVPAAQWPGILAGNGFSPAVVAAFVEMNHGINAGVVVAQDGSERRRGATTLAAAAKALLGQPH
jgi:uncharacterized protein YbjT (DUF2867 family)